jgi:hypothetical protein
MLQLEYFSQRSMLDPFAYRMSERPRKQTLEIPNSMHLQESKRYSLKMGQIVLSTACILVALRKMVPSLANLLLLANQ